jgi:hypothetical protein
VPHRGFQATFPRNLTGKVHLEGLMHNSTMWRKTNKFPLTLVLSWISKKDDKELSHMSHRELYENSLCHEDLRDITHMSQEQCLLFQAAGILISSNSTADRDSVNSALEFEDHDFYHHLQAATSFTNFERESSFEACTLIPVKSRSS